MKVRIFLNDLGLGGTEKAACLWARLLALRGHDITVVSLVDGPRRSDLEQQGVGLRIVGHPQDPRRIAELITDADVVHAHAPGFPHAGDVLGEALRFQQRRIPVVQTNIFGNLRNPAEDEWTSFRLFISWTSCVQAAQRSYRPLDLDFFHQQSVAVYPVEDPFDAVTERALRNEAAAFREDLGINSANPLFGRFSRPEPNKWSPLLLRAFFEAHRKNAKIRLLLREPPPAVAEMLCKTGRAVWGGQVSPSDTAPVILLRATADPSILSIGQMACDAILHTSSIGESFGYGIAEPMALQKPVITNSVPWHDQAQIELVQHGKCGFVASSVRTMSAAILRLSNDVKTCNDYGRNARCHILRLADPNTSTDRLLGALGCAVEGRANPWASNDLLRAQRAAHYLDCHQWGTTWRESWHLHTRSSLFILRALWRCTKLRTMWGRNSPA